MKNIVVIVIGILVVGLLIVYGSNNWIKVNTVEVPFKNLPGDFNGMKIVHLSDLHAADFGADEKNLIKIVKEQQPDLIVFTGDIIDYGDKDREKALVLMTHLVDIGPVYFVSGNHDYSSDYYALTKSFRDLGVIVLNNVSQRLSRKDSHIYMAGLADPFTNQDDMKKALKGIKREEFTLLLSHTPDVFGKAVTNGVELVLAGHYHGGQIRLPFIRAIYAPGHKIFPRYDSGLYKDNLSYMYLSRGLGSTGILKFRFWNRPEVAVIILQSREST